MQAHLHDPLGLPGDFDHPPPLVDGLRERLLDIDVLARPTGGDGLQGVPVVGRGHHDGVDVGPIEELAKIIEEHGLAAQLLAGLFQGRLADVAQGGHLGVGIFQKGPDQLHAAIGHADQAQSHPIVGPQHVRGLGGGKRGRRRGGSALDKRTAGDRLRHNMLLDGLVWRGDGLRETETWRTRTLTGPSVGRCGQFP